jgi:hypothetical protein
MGRLGIVVGVIGVICVVGLWVSQCSGPRPVVDSAPVVLPPEQPGQPYRVDVAIRNAGPGHGEVQVTFSLRERTTGKTYQRIDHAQLESGDLTHVAVEIPAPQGDYEPAVQVDYPPG